VAILPIARARDAFPLCSSRVLVLSEYDLLVPVVMKECKGPCGQEKSPVFFYNDRSQPDGKTKRCIECIKDARKKGSPKVAGEASMNLSEDERRRRSEQARAQVAAGEIGGVEHGKKGGRPKVASLTDYVLDQLREEGDLFVDALRKGLESGDERVAVRAFQVGLDMEGKALDRELKQKQGKQVGEMTRDELIEAIVRGVAELEQRGEMPEEPIDVDFEEMPAAELAAG
jgi:hypothetical protein